MGYDPAPELNSRYYAIGIGNAGSGINGTAFGTATNSGLAAAQCPQAATIVTSGTTTTATALSTWFPAGKGAGGVVNNSTVPTGSTIGPQNNGNENFTISAEGIIGSNNIILGISGNASLITIDESKMLSIVRPGY